MMGDYILRYTFRTKYTPFSTSDETESYNEYTQYSHFYRTQFDDLQREMEHDEWSLSHTFVSFFTFLFKFFLN